MKSLKNLEVDIIGEQRELTAEEKLEISEFFKKRKLAAKKKNLKRPAGKKRTKAGKSVA